MRDGLYDPRTKTPEEKMTQAEKKKKGNKTRKKGGKGKPDAVKCDSESLRVFSREKRGSRKPKA